MSISSIGSLFSGSSSNLSSILSKSKSTDSSVVSSNLLNSLDANHDKKWSYDEVSTYAKKYEDLTGNALNVSDIFKNDDTNGDNTLNTSEQASLINSDGLGLNALNTGNKASGTSLIDTMMANEPSMSDTLLMSSLMQESSSSLISLMFNSDSAGSTNLLSGIYGKTNSASMAEAYWASKYDETATSPKVDTKA
jgi:hypothetical protein